MEKGWMPKIAGILDIVAGSLSFVGIIFACLGILVLATIGSPDVLMGIPTKLIFVVTAIVATFFIVIDTLAIVGGVYALRRKVWGLSLAGSIAAFFASTLLGTAAITFTVLSKSEFK